VKFINVQNVYGETHYMAQEIRKTNPETMMQQRKADVNRDVRISIYKKRYSRGENIFTGDPLTAEEQEEEGELLNG